MPVIGGGSSNPTAQVGTFLSIYLEILNRMRQPVNVSGILEQAKRYANIALNDIVLGFEYQLPWLERSATLRMRAPYTIGTVALTVGSTTVTGTSTLWTTVDAYGDANVRAGGKITFGGSDIYTVTAVGGAGTLTLDNRYVGTASVATSNYTYFEDEYNLASDFLKPVDVRSFTSVYKLPIIGRNEFRRAFPRPNTSGRPTVATILDKAFNGDSIQEMSLQVYPYPSAAYLLPYAYVTNNLAVSSAGVEQANMSADNDEPMLPARYRHLIVLGAIAQWYRDKKDDARAMSAQSDYNAGIQRLVNDQRIGANTAAKITPMVRNMTRTYNRAIRRFSTNNSFDEFRT
jgi:hypothetical protein